MKSLYLTTELAKTKLVILKAVIKAFKSKKRIISKNDLTLFNTSAYFILDIYFFAKKSIIKYKKKWRKQKKALIFLKKVLSYFNITTILIKIINLNKNLKKLQVKNMFYKLKKFKFTLFNKNTKMFINFVKLTVLLLKKKLNIVNYLEQLTKLFQPLNKKFHSKFLFFIKFLLKLLIRQNTAFSRIIGVQFTLTGRLKGKPRSKKKKIVVGKLSCQTINSKIN